MKNISCLLIMLLFFYTAHSQSKTQTYNSMTFYYVDNSAEYELPGLSSGVKDELRQQLKSDVGYNNHYSYLWMSNGSKSYQGDDAERILENDQFKRILNRDANPAKYEADIQSIREHFTLFPVSVKQEIVFDFYLSANAVNRLFTDVYLIPTPISICGQIIQFVKSSGKLKLRLNVYTDESTKAKYSETDLISSLNFCSLQLASTEVETKVFYR